MMKVISINVGKRVTVEWKGREITTGIFKNPVDTSVFLGYENVEGDSICDKKVHGGKNRAVYAYGEHHYAYWKGLYPNLVINYGMLGENLTVSNLEETEVHIGDQFKVGEAIIEVTSPREPCLKLGMKFDSRKAMKQMLSTTKCGIYFKVIKEGDVRAGDSFVRTKKCNENKTIAEVFKKKT